MTGGGGEGMPGKKVEGAGSGSEVAHGPPRAGDIRHSVAKVDKAASLLRFQARTPLHEGLASTLDWMRGQL